MKSRSKALVIGCTDFRVQEAVREYLQRIGLSGANDLLTLPGEVKCLAEESGPVREFLLDEDCGAYGGAAAFASREEERRRHLRNIEEAQRLILGRNPDYTFRTAFAVLEHGRFRVTDLTPRRPSP